MSKKIEGNNEPSSLKTLSRIWKELRVLEKFCSLDDEQIEKLLKKLK